MEGIVHIRVDDRLIHGQVATRWATGLRVNRIMIIDDKV
ncbi:PTS sugar transporter subunit IIB, partial [Bacillus cereus]